MEHLSYAEATRRGGVEKQPSAGDRATSQKRPGPSRAGGTIPMAQSNFPSISMQGIESEHDGDPLASPPHYQIRAGDILKPRSFAATTREHHVKPEFEDIPLRNPVLQNGKQVMVFSPTEVGKLSRPFSWSLVGNFGSRRPTLMQIRLTLKRVRSFSQYFFVGAIDDNHVIIRFQNRGDFVNAYIKKEWKILGKLMQVFRWSPRFTPGVESTCAPIWVEFPYLRAHLQSPRALQSLAGMVGKFLYADRDAEEFTRPGVTRVCVEVDFSKPIPKQLWIDNG